MTRGGKRPNAGRPSRDTVRRAMVSLDAAHSAMLTEIEAGHGSTSNALLWCIRVAHERLSAQQKRRKE